MQCTHKYNVVLTQMFAASFKGVSMWKKERECEWQR